MEERTVLVGEDNGWDSETEDSWTVEISVDSDGDVWFRRVSSEDYLLFSKAEWREMVEFVKRQQAQVLSGELDQ